MAGFNLTAQLNLRGPSNVKQIVSDIKKQLGTVTGDINLKVNPTATKNITQLNSVLSTLNTNLSQVSTNATSASNAISAFASAANSINKATSSTSSNINKTVASTNKLVQSQATASKAINQSTSEMQEFGKQSALAVRRFAAFSGATGVILGLGGAIRKGLSEFIAYEKEFVKIQQVTDKTASQLKGLDQEIRKLSVGLGVSSSELIKVSSTLAQAGLSAKEAQQALQALALTDLAPSFDSLNETVEGSIALMRQFSIGAGDLEKALGSVNAVAAAFAVESSDLIAAIQRTGGVFASASKGVSEGTQALNEFLAIFTSVRQTTRESAETIATGLRTIFTRIQRADTIEALREYGVNLTDLEGKFVGAYKGVELLSKGLNSIDPRDLRFSQIVEELGGFRQIGKVIPLIQQFGVAQQALGVAQRGQASLARDALTAQLSLANQISKVREEFLALMRSVGSSDTFQTIAKSALGFTSVLLKVADSIKGLLPILAIVGIGKLSKSIGEFGTGFVGGLFKGGKGGGGGGGNAPTNSGGIPPILGGGGSGNAIPANLAQNLALLDDILLQNTDAINNLGTSLSGLTTALGSITSFSTAIQANTASLTSNTTSIQALTAAVTNLSLGGGAPGAPFNLGGTVKKFARGGVVPGSGNSDTVPAMLMPGEFVIRKKAVETIGAENLHSMNKYGGGGSIRSGRSGKRKKFAAGGAARIDKIVSIDDDDFKDGDTFAATVMPKAESYKEDVRIGTWDAWEKRNPLNPDAISTVRSVNQIDKIKGLNKNKPSIVKFLDDNRKKKKVPGDAIVYGNQTALELAEEATGALKTAVGKRLDGKSASEAKIRETRDQTRNARLLIDGIDIDDKYKTGRIFKNLGGKIQKFMAGGQAKETRPFGSGTFPFPKRISNAYFKEIDAVLQKEQAEKAFSGGLGYLEYPSEKRIRVESSRAIESFDSTPLDRVAFAESFKKRASALSIYKNMSNFAKFIGLPREDLSLVLPESIEFTKLGGLGPAGQFDRTGMGKKGIEAEGYDLSSLGFGSGQEQDLYGYEKLVAEKQKEIKKILKTPTKTFDDGSFSYDEVAAKKTWDEINDLQLKIMNLKSTKIKAQASVRDQIQATAAQTGRGTVSLNSGGLGFTKNDTFYHELTHQLFQGLRTRSAESFDKYKERVVQLFGGDNDQLVDAFDSLESSYNSADVVYGRSYKIGALDQAIQQNRSINRGSRPAKTPDAAAAASTLWAKSLGIKKAKDFKPVNPEVNQVLLDNSISQSYIDRIEDSGKEEFLTTLLQNAPKLDSTLQGALDSTLSELLGSVGIQRQQFSDGGEAKLLKRGNFSYSLDDIAAAAQRSGMSFEDLKAKVEERKTTGFKDFVFPEYELAKQFGLKPYTAPPSTAIAEFLKNNPTLDSNLNRPESYRSARASGRYRRYAIGGDVDPKDTLQRYFEDSSGINEGLNSSKSLSQNQRNELASDVRAMRKLRTQAPKKLYSSISRVAFDTMASQVGLNKNPKIPEGTKLFDREKYYQQEVNKIDGGSFSLPGFVSTSKEFAKAKLFLDNGPRSEDNWAAMMTILTKQNELGVDTTDQLSGRQLNLTKQDINPRSGKMETFTRNPPEAESEFVLSPRSRFKINNPKFVDSFGKKNLWMDVQRFINGGQVERKLGIIDTDVLRDPSNESIINPEMEKLGITNVSEYSRRLAQLAAEARKNKSLSRLIAIAGSAGSGKSSLATGRGAPDNASLRKTIRSSILTPDDISKVNEVIVLTSTASQEKLDAYLKDVDRAYILSSNERSEQDRVGSNRQSRDNTGEGLYGRKPGTTNSASRDFALEESILRDELGDKAMVLGRKPDSFGLRRKKEDELPEIVQAGGYYTGGFAPPTRGHRGAFDTLLSNMISRNPNASAEDIVVSVAPNLSMDRGEGDTEAEQLAHASRYGIFPADFRTLLAGINFPGGMISTESSGRGDVLPKMMEVQAKDGRRRFAKLDGALAITSGKKAGALSKYERAGVQVTDIPRIDDISATSVRDALFNGDDATLMDSLSPEVASILMGNRAQLRNRSIMVPMLIEEITKYGATQKAQTNAEIQKMLAEAPGGPYGKITKTARENAPDVVAQVEAMREQRDALSSSLLGYRAHNIISLLSAKYPDAYGLDPSRRASVSAQPSDLTKDIISAQLSESMSGEFGGVSTAMPSGLEAAILKNVEKATQVKKSSGILPAQGTEILKRFGAERLPNDPSFGPFSGKTVRDTADGGKLKYWNSAFRPETKADKLAYYTATRDYLIDRFNQSQGTQKATTLAETTNAVLSSTQLGLVGLNPLGYTGLLGPETWNLGVDPSGQERSIDASIIQRGLPTQYKSVIDYLSGQTEELVGGASKLLGISPKKLSQKERETLGQGNIEGALLEQIFGSAGATILDDAQRTRPIDFPSGIGAKAATIFGIDPDIPTEVKRTIDSGSRGKAVEEFKRYFRQQYGIPEPTEEAIQKLAVGGPVKLYHGSNTGIEDAVLKSFKEKGALSNIATGYGQGAGFYVYTEKDRAVQQAKMRVQGGGLGTVVSGDTSGKPMVLTFDQQLTPEDYDLDYELQKNLVTQWVYDNFDKAQSALSSQPNPPVSLLAKMASNKEAGIMSSGIRLQEGDQTLKGDDGQEYTVKGGARRSIYSGTSGDIREGELLGKLMSGLKAGDPELVQTFESKLFEKPYGLVLKYVGSSPLKPTNIETFAYGGRAGISPEDTVPALLTPGEFVINKDAAQKIGYSKLQKLNQADKLQGYNSGGFVRRYAAGSGGPVPGGGPGGGGGSPIDPAAKAAADALSYFALQAEYYGKSVGEYQKSLKQQIVERALAMRQEMPKDITSFKLKANQLRGILEAPDTASATVPEEVSNARDELKTLLARVAGPSMDDDALSGVIQDLEARIESGLSFDEAIRATDSLTNVFKNATDTGEQYTRVLEEFSAATGVAQEELEKVASFDAVETANRFNQVSEAGNKLFGRLTKLAGVATIFSGILGRLLEAEGSKTSRVLSAGVQGGVGAAAQGVAYGQATFSNLSSVAQSTSLPSSVTGAAGQAAAFMTSGVGLALGGVAVAAIGVAAALKDASNAAREFDIEQANKSIDESLQRVSNYFTDFAKDVKNTNILALIEQELVTGIGNALASIRLQTEVPKTFWANLIDSLSNGDAGSAERSRVLEQQGIGAYSETTAFAQNPLGFIAQGATFGYGDAILQAISGGNLGLGVGPNSAAQQEASANRNIYTRQAAPQLAQQNSSILQPIAEKTLQLGEEKLKAGVSDLSEILATLGTSSAPSEFAQTLARSNPVIEEQIIRIRASNTLTKTEQEAKISAIIAIEAESKARARFAATINQLELEKLNKELKVFTTSISRMLNNMSMAINKATFEIDRLAAASELSNKALAGSASIGDIALKSINVLQNPRVYSAEDQAVANNQASSMFGPASGPISQLIGIGDKMESTVLKTINRVIDNRSDSSPEAISGAVRAALNTSLNDLGLPPELSEKLSKEVQKSFAELRTGEDKKISFAELVEKVPQFAEAITTAKDAQESAIKALEFWQSQVNNYSKAMNQAMEYQLESNERLRKSTDIRIKSEEDLSKTLGKPSKLLDQRQNTLARTASLTGGATDPTDIANNLLRLNNVRATQQGMIGEAAAGGPQNASTIEKMTRNLNLTNIALRENYQALKDMADSGDEASAALSKVSEAQQKNQAAQNIIEKLVTSNAVEINKFNRSLGMLNNNMAGGTNNSTPEERSQVLQTFNMIAPLLGDQQNPLKANVLESLLKEAGIGINGLFADVLTSLRSPESDPNVTAALQYYKEAIAKQIDANNTLAKLQEIMAANTAEVAGAALAKPLESKFDFQSVLLSDIREGINKLVDIAGAAPAVQNRANGGIIYADGGALVNFQPKGTDTVPAMLTPGEFVVNRQATQKNLPLLKDINNNKTSYYAIGGVVRGVAAPWGKGINSIKQNNDDVNNDTNDNDITQNKFLKFKDISSIPSAPDQEIMSAPLSFYASAPAGPLNLARKPDNPGQSVSLNGLQAIPGASYDKITGYTSDKISKIDTNNNARNALSNFKSLGKIVDLNKLDNVIDINEKDNLNVKDINEYKIAYDKMIKLLQSSENINKQISKSKENHDLNKQIAKANSYFRSNVKFTNNGANPPVGQSYSINDLFYNPGGNNNSLLFYGGDAMPAIGTNAAPLLGFDKNITNVVGGSANMHWTSTKRMVEDNTLQYDADAGSQNQKISNSLSQLISLRESIISSYKELRDPTLEFVETNETAAAKSFVSNLDAFYDGKIFKTILNSDFVQPPPKFADAALPLTVYNMGEQEWSDYIKQAEATIPNLNDSRNKSYSAPAFGGENFLKLEEYRIIPGKNPTDPFLWSSIGERKVPWTSSDFNDKGINNQFEQKFMTGRGKASEIINSTEKTYGEIGSGKYHIIYNQIKGKLFDTTKGNFGDQEYEYIVVDPTKNKDFNPGSPLGEIDNRLLVAKDIKSLVGLLDQTTPSYNIQTGMPTMAPKGNTFRYSFGRDTGSGLIATNPKVKQLLSGNAQYAGLNKDLEKYIVSATDSTSWETILADGYQIASGKYKDEREKRILNRRKELMKQNAGKVNGQDLFSLKESLSEEDKKAGMNVSDLESFSPAKRVTLARYFYDKYSKDFGIRSGKPTSVAGLIKIANELDSYASETSKKKEGQYGAQWNRINALRAAFTSLAKPADDIGTYFKRLGFPLKNKDYKNRVPVAQDPANPDRTPVSYYESIIPNIDGVMDLLLQRESDFSRATQNVNGPNRYDLYNRDELKQNLQNATDNFSLSEINKDGKVVEVKDKQKITAFADVEKIALNPYNLPSQSSDRQTLLGELAAFYENDKDKTGEPIWPDKRWQYIGNNSVFGDKDVLKADDIKNLAPNGLRDWYAVQDNILNKSKNENQLREQSNEVYKAGFKDSLNKIRDASQDWSTYLTGNLYGLLPDWDWIVNKLGLIDPKADAAAAAADPNILSKGGMVYASEGQYINFQPRGTDTVPAMLTPGEFVVNRASTSKNLPLLQAINKSKGGSVSYFQNGGPVGAVDSVAMNNSQMLIRLNKTQTSSLGVLRSILEVLLEIADKIGNLKSSGTATQNPVYSGSTGAASPIEANEVKKRIPLPNPKPPVSAEEPDVADITPDDTPVDFSPMPEMPLPDFTPPEFEPIQLPPPEIPEIPMPDFPMPEQPSFEPLPFPEIPIPEMPLPEVIPTEAPISSRADTNWYDTAFPMDMPSLNIPTPTYETGRYGLETPFFDPTTIAQPERPLNISESAAAAGVTMEDAQAGRDAVAADLGDAGSFLDQAIAEKEARQAYNNMQAGQTVNNVIGGAQDIQSALSNAETLATSDNTLERVSAGLSLAGDTASLVGRTGLEIPGMNTIGGIAGTANSAIGLEEAIRTGDAYGGASSAINLTSGALDLASMANLPGTQRAGAIGRGLGFAGSALDTANIAMESSSVEDFFNRGGAQSALGTAQNAAAFAGDVAAYVPGASRLAGAAPTLGVAGAALEIGRGGVAGYYDDSAEAQQRSAIERVGFGALTGDATSGNAAATSSINAIAGGEVIRQGGGMDAWLAGQESGLRGAGAGAAIGTYFAPGIGTAVGGTVGYAAGVTGELGLSTTAYMRESADANARAQKTEQMLENSKTANKSVGDATYGLDVQESSYVTNIADIQNEISVLQELQKAREEAYQFMPDEQVNSLIDQATSNEIVSKEKQLATEQQGLTGLATQRANDDALTFFNLTPDSPEVQASMKRYNEAIAKSLERISTDIEQRAQSATSSVPQPQTQTGSYNPRFDSYAVYRNGGVVYASEGQMVNFQPQGTDTVPAMLTPGEFVINRNATSKHFNLLNAINNGTYSQGEIAAKFNTGGYVSPNYYRSGSYVSPAVSRKQDSFDFAGFMQKLMGQLSSVISEALRESLRPSNNAQNIDNRSNGVSIDTSILDRINEFTNRLKSVADTLAGLNAIPSEIRITGKHDINVVINGDSALNQLRPELQQLVMNEIKSSFQRLINQNSPLPSDKLINPFDSNIG
jgi:TP901 family phage tail tape measure protein